MKPIAKKAISLVSGAAGVISAVLWHLASDAQLQTATMSKATAVAMVEAQQTSLPDITKFKLAIEQASRAAEAFNEIALIENNWAAVLAVVASICVAAVLFFDD
jgi:phosphomevalonate kinase